MHAKARIETPYGPAASDWRIDCGLFHLDVTIPPNTSARLRLPADADADIRVDGRSLSELPEASAVRVEQGRVTMNLLSGDYRFEIRPAAGQ